MNRPYRQPTLASTRLAQIAPQQQPSRRSARLQNISSARDFSKDIPSTLSLTSQPANARNPDALAHSDPSRKRKASQESAPAHSPISPPKTQSHIPGLVDDIAKSPVKGASRARLLLSPSTSVSTHKADRRRAKRARKSVQEPSPETPYKTFPPGQRERLSNYSEANLQPTKRFKRYRKGVKTPIGTSKASQITNESVIDESLQEHASPVEYWTAHQTWPENFADYPQMSSSKNSGKRPRRSDASQSDSRSYSLSRKEGRAPPQYTPEYQNRIAELGLKMDVLQGRQFVSDESKNLCKDLQQAAVTAIQPSIFPTDMFQQVINYYQNRNEAILQRDITPLLAPSIASLFFGSDQSVEHLCDEVNARWYTQCVLYGPTPKPDLAVGLSRSAFDRAELEKLDRYKSSANWTQVTEYLFFPFFTCEVKCGNEGLDRADRQNMHSCSIAVRAILRIVQEADRYRSEKKFPGLSGQILVFSVSHDQKNARIHGHYAVCEGDRWTYYRHLIKTFLIFESESDLLMAHNFVRNVFKAHAPNHLKRLRQAISAFPEPSGLSLSASTLTVDEESQEPSTEAETMSDVEYDAGFRKPDLPPKAKQEKEMNKMREQIDRLIEQLREKDEKAQQQQEKAQQQQEKAQQQMDKLLQQLRDRDEKARQQMDKLLQQLEQQRRDGRK